MRPAVFILLTLALSAPTLANVLTGSDSALNAGEHLTAAIVISWFGVGVVGYLIDSYRAAVAQREDRRGSQNVD
jgi:hypothetical protein